MVLCTWHGYQECLPNYTYHINSKYYYDHHLLMDDFLMKALPINADNEACLDFISVTDAGWENDQSESSNYFFTVLSESRDHFARYMKENEVYCTFRYHPLHRINLFKKSSDIKSVDGANKFSDTALNIPIHQNLTDKEVSIIVNLLSSYKADSL